MAAPNGLFQNESTLRKLVYRLRKSSKQSRHGDVNLQFRETGAKRLCTAASFAISRAFAPFLWPRGGVVTQRIANPCTPVRFRAWPPQSQNTLISTGESAWHSSARQLPIELHDRLKETVDEKGCFFYVFPQNLYFYCGSFWLISLCQQDYAAVDLVLFEKMGYLLH